MTLYSLSRCLLLLLATAALFGCGPAEPKARPTTDVSGSVTLDGQPLADGEIFFVNVAEGVNESLPIAGGKFSGKASPGSRKVEIRAYKDAAPSKEAAEMYGADAQGSKEQFLPAKYNSETTLTADVKEGGPPLDFAVTSQ
jgi:hypothetical protein